MEEDIRKQGILYLQQQRFGKKWKRVWCVLYRESSCSISRLEFYECKDGGHVEKNDKSLRKQQEHKKVIRLSDCIRVTEVDRDSCPRDTGPFLVETTDKSYVFAADRQHLDDWTHKLCEIAFPVSWVEHHVKRGSLQRGRHVDENEGMEDNSLYSGRETVRDFRVCVRRTEASDRCRLKGDGILRAGADALHLLDKTGDVVLMWPYRYLRRFGRDKSTFSFEAGRRCESGEGSFEFDTKQGNFLFQSVEAAINLQRSSAPHRQTSGGGRASPERPDLMVTPAPIQSRTLPPPQPRSLYTQATGAQADDCVYSVVSGGGIPSQQSCLEPPLDKTLTGVKSLTLDARGVPVPRKSQVKMISSCPLPAPGPELGAMLAPGPAHHLRLSPRLSSAASSGQMYSEASLLTERGSKTESRGDARCSAQPPPDPDYSLPFDTIAKKVVVDRVGSEAACGAEPAPDPLYDSIDEMQIRNIFLSDGASLTAAYGKVEHIYDEPEGRAVPAAAAAAATTVMSADPPSVYDDPEEMRGDAWRIMGTTVDPKGHEYPYNPRLDDYAIPKRVQRAFPTAQSKQGEEEEEEEEKEACGRGQEAEPQDSPYNNVTVKKQCE